MILITILVLGSEEGSDKWLKEFLPNLFSTLLVVPDNPEHGVIYLIRGTMNAINKYSWEKNQPFKALALIDAIKMFSTACQEIYPYGYENLESNDVLYGSDEHFIAEICNMTGTMISLVNDHIEYFDETKNNDASNRIRIELLFTILNFGNLGKNPELKTFVIGLGQAVLSSSSLPKKEREMVKRCCMWIKGENRDKNVRKIITKIYI